MEKRRVVITGMGVIAPNGNGVETYWNSMVSNQIVRDYRGYIDVESELNKGSSFFVNLPVDQDHPKRRKDDSENERNISDTFEKR